MLIDTRKIVIATPMYGGMCCVNYMASVVETVSFLKEQGYKVALTALGNESLITRARNTLVHTFLQTDAKYLLFVDADIGFTSKDVQKLLNSQKQLICGVYPKKTIDWNRVNQLATLNIPNLENYAAKYVIDSLETVTSKSETVVEIRHGGTGFMLIDRVVFETLSPYVKEYRIATNKIKNEFEYPLVKNYFDLSIQDTGEEGPYLLSEDYHFCALWRNHGGKVYADLSINLTHMGTYEYRGNIQIGGINYS